MKTKKFILFCLIGMIGMGASADTSGTCGANVKWTLSNGVLSITGTGPMTDYEPSEVPWRSQDSSITSVTIGYGVTSIGAYSFSFCNYITSISIPSSITTIGEQAFISCFRLKSITLPNSLVSIGDGAFVFCYALTSISLPNSVESIGGGLFTGSGITTVNIGSGLRCIKNEYGFGSELTTINVDPSNATYTTYNGMFINKETSTLLYCPRTKTGAIKIPDSITKIERYAFIDCPFITSISIPSTVNSINLSHSQFDECTSLVSIDVDAANTNYFSQDGVLYGSWGYDKRLLRCPKAKEGNIALLRGTKIIEPNAFKGCVNLTSITSALNTPPEIMADYDNFEGFETTIFENTTLIVREYNQESYKNAVGWSNFANVYTIPSQFEVDGFLYNPLDDDNLSTVSFGGLPNNQKCSGDVIIPSSISYDGRKYTIVDMGWFIFAQCPDLTSVTIPASLNGSTAISAGSFLSSNSLQNVNVEEGNPSYFSIDGVLYSRYYNEWTMTWSASLIICPPAKEGGILIPDTAKILYTSPMPFEECSKLTAINVNETNEQYVSVDGVLYTKDKTTLFACPPGKEDVTILPNVTKIGSYAFNTCRKLTSIELPEGISTINNSAFQKCSGLTGISIPSTTTSIGGSAFNNCSSLKVIQLSKQLTSIGRYTFNGCSSLTEINFPNAIKTIEGYAFANCSCLSNVLIPTSVETIDESAFFNCANLCSIDVDENNESFSSENGILYDKTKTTLIQCPSGIAFEKIEIPNTVTTINSYAFAYCPSIKSIIIPESVTTINDGAIYYCSNIKHLICLAVTPPTLGSIIGEWNWNEKPILHVIKGCKEAYTSQGNWRQYFIVAEGVFNVKYKDTSDNETILSLSYDDPENNIFTLPDTYKSVVVTEDIPLKQISYERNFTNKEWQSLYVPFEIPITSELLDEFDFAYINAARQYDYDDDGEIDDLTIEVFKVKSGTLRANHPYLIRAKSTGEKTITVNEATLYATEENSIDCSTTSLLFTFKGGYETLGYDGLGGCYLLGGGEWKTPTPTTTMKPMRFYMKIESRGSEQIIPAASSATPIRMTVVGEDGETTEIEASPLSSPEGKEIIFDLQGRRVEHPEKGIYIINGKKVLVQ